MGSVKNISTQGPSIPEKASPKLCRGDIILINDFENDPRIQNLEAARTEGVTAVIGIPFTVNETTYAILRIYFASKKVPSHDEISFLKSLGKLACLAIERSAMREMPANPDQV